MTTAQNIVRGFAVAAQTIGRTTSDPVASGAARGAALILGLVANLLDRRSPEEAEKALRKILDEGTQPLTPDDLDAQMEEVLAELARDTLPR